MQIDLRLKCSNKNMKVTAKDGYICVEYGKKAGKATITCTVKEIYQSCKFDKGWKQELYFKICKK